MPTTKTNGQNHDSFITSENNFIPMKISLSIFAQLFFLITFSYAANAGDIYAEYKMTGMGSAPIISKIYGKNGNMRTEVNMNMGGKQFTTFTLMLKSNPNVYLIFNSLNKTYTEAKMSSGVATKEVAIKLLGNEKIGIYNCTHVRMTADGKSWDAWYTKDLPSFNFPVNGNSEFSSLKVINDLKSKGITGMLAKIVFQPPNVKEKGITMELLKFENKILNSSLFTIPIGYKKSTVNFDPEKMKTMTAEQKKEMIMKMMKEQSKH